MDFNISFKRENTGFNSAVLYLNEKFRSKAENINNEIRLAAQEIRLRVNKSPAIVCPNKTYFLAHDGTLSLKETPFFVVPTDIQETIKIICSYSIYSYQSQIKNGFITLRGGHRAGICGTAVINGGEITNIRDISSINIRIAKEIKGCSDKILKKITYNPKGTLIAGPPSSGKTTILRDLARNLSLVQNGPVKKIAIIDERGEIAAVYNGIPQVDIGLCDVLNGYPKGEGILQAVRVLSPNIVICDEMGNISEINAIEEGLNSGAEIIASVHCGDKKDLFNKPQIKRLLATKAFSNIILLSKISKCTGEFEFINAEDIYDKDFWDNNDSFCRDYSGANSLP